jgi:hypothetical protein
MTVHFRFESSYRLSADYLVTDATGTYRVEFRSDAYPYEGSHYNGSAEEYERDVVGGIGLLRRYIADRPPSQEVVDAFNAWRLEEHLTWRRKIEADPDRYGVLKPGDHFLTPPMVARGAHYETGRGWIVATA